MHLTTLRNKVVASLAAGGAGLAVMLGAGPGTDPPRTAAPAVLADCGEPTCPTAPDDAHWG